MLAAVNRKVGILVFALAGGLVAIWLIARDRHASESIDVPEHSSVLSTAEPSSSELDLPPTAEEPDVEGNDGRTVVPVGPGRRRSGGTSLFGTVTDQNGSPIASAALWVVTSLSNGVHLVLADKSNLFGMVLTDAAGHFSTPPIGAGIYWMGLAPPNAVDISTQPRDVSTLVNRVQVKGDAERQEVNLRLFRGLFVRGKVLSPEGGPATAVVKAILPSGVVLEQVTTDDDGLFAAGPLSPGRFKVQAFSPGVYIESEPVDASAGESGVELKLVQGGLIEGFAVEQETRQPVVADVIAYRHESNELIPIVGDGEAYFRAAGLQPGTYDICARSRNKEIGLARDLQVGRGPTAPPVTIGLSPGAIVVINNSEALDVHECELYVEDACIGSAYLNKAQDEFRVVPPGPIQVRYKIGERARTVTVNAVVGSEVRVSIPR